MSFEPRSNADLARLIEAAPLAWVVSAHDGRPFATPLPLLLETDAEGEPVDLLGHFALRNPQVAALQASPRATILFMGPNGYISPEGIRQPQWGPTWNYACARFDTEIHFQREATDEALNRLAAAMERERAQPWQTADMGPRYAELAQHVIAFRARIFSVNSRFKLGQDESPQTRADILTHLQNPALAEWMREFNPAPIDGPQGANP